jgi:hypothetical protein
MHLCCPSHTILHLLEEASHVASTVTLATFPVLTFLGPTALAFLAGAFLAGAFLVGAFFTGVFLGWCDPVDIRPVCFVLATWMERDGESKL